MWAQGVEAIPCYHVGEPESILKGIAKDYPKIALGGCVGYRDKDNFAAQCFARVWPKKIHGFGFGSEKSVMALPWHSVDATNWEIGPCKFGRWQSYGKMSVRGSKQNLRAEVEWYLALEQRARQRWKKEMAKLDAAEGSLPAGRLAMANTQEKAYSTDKYPNALGPIVRLVANANAGREDVKAYAFGSTELTNATVRLAADPASGGGVVACSPPSVRLAYSETGAVASPRIDAALCDGKS
jgi:hypothetical protein